MLLSLFFPSNWFTRISMPILVILVAILASIGGQTAASKVRYCLTSALTYKTPQQQNEIFRRCILHKAKVSIKFCFYIQTFWKVFNFPHRILNITALLLFPVCSPTSQKLVQRCTIYWLRLYLNKKRKYAVWYWYLQWKFFETKKSKMRKHNAF